MRLLIVILWILLQVVLCLQTESAFAQDCNWRPFSGEYSIERIKTCAEKSKGFGGSGFPVIAEHEGGRYLEVTNCPYSGVSTCHTTLFEISSKKKWIVLATVSSRELANVSHLLEAVTAKEKLK